MCSVPLIFNILHHKAIICSYKCLSTSILIFLATDVVMQAEPRTLYDAWNCMYVGSFGL